MTSICSDDGKWIARLNCLGEILEFVDAIHPAGSLVGCCHSVCAILRTSAVPMCDITDIAVMGTVLAVEVVFPSVSWPLVVTQCSA